MLARAVREGVSHLLDESGVALGQHTPGERTGLVAQDDRSIRRDGRMGMCECHLRPRRGRSSLSWRPSPSVEVGGEPVSPLKPYRDIAGSRPDRHSVARSVHGDSPGPPSGRLSRPTVAVAVRRRHQGGGQGRLGGRDCPVDESAVRQVDGGGSRRRAAGPRANRCPARRYEQLHLAGRPARRGGRPERAFAAVHGGSAEASADDGEDWDGLRFIPHTEGHAPDFALSGAVTSTFMSTFMSTSDATGMTGVPDARAGMAT